MGICVFVAVPASVESYVLLPESKSGFVDAGCLASAGVCVCLDCIGSGVSRVLKFATAGVAVCVALLGGCTSSSERRAPAASNSVSVRIHDLRAVALADDDALPVPVSARRARQLLAIAERMSQVSGTRLHAFVVTEHRELNAAVTVGGGRTLLLVTRPLISRLGEDDAAVAALIGHELAHAALGHQPTRKSFPGAVALGAQWLGAVAGAFLPGAGTALSFGAQAAAQAYSRDQEEQADATGLAFLVRAGYEPAAMLRLIEALPVQGDGTTGILDSHPANSRRVENIRKLLSQ